MPYDLLCRCTCLVGSSLSLSQLSTSLWGQTDREWSDAEIIAALQPHVHAGEVLITASGRYTSARCVS